MTTRAIVLADTHLPRRNRTLPAPVLDALKTADLIVHLGDFTQMEVALSLVQFGPLLAVHGNNDSEEVRAAYPAMQRVEIEGHRVVLIHGDIGGRTALAAASAISDADVVLFGHSHQPLCRRAQGILLLNPGSPTDQRWSPYRCFATIEFGETIEPELVPLSNL